jgi:hypothetical protein
MDTFAYERLLVRYDLALLKFSYTVRFVPAWIPGAGFKTEAQECSAALSRVIEEPFKMALEDVVRICEAQSWQNELTLSG